jgi:sugar phosphate isomerase/epimerase
MNRMAPNAKLSRITRRRWLAAAAASAVVACGRNPLAAIEPIDRGSHGSHFKFSLAAYSYRELLTGEDPAMSLFDFVDACAALQLDGTELTSYYFPPDVDDAYLYRLRAYCFARGLDVSGTAVGNDFALPPGPERDQQLALVKRWIDYAQKLGAPVIRIFAGRIRPGDDPQVAHRWIVEGIQECCEVAGGHGVHLALENHGGPTATSEGLMKLVGDVRSPWFGVNLDTGNFHTEDIYGDLARVAPYCLNVQVKASVSGPDGASRPTDYGRLDALLRQAGYRGYVVLEYEEPGDPRAGCRREMEKLRQALGHGSSSDPPTG